MILMHIASSKYQFIVLSGESQLYFGSFSVSLSGVSRWPDTITRVAHVKHDYKMKEIADYLGVYYTTVSKLLKNEEIN
jgi:hypothetical protein